MNATVDADLLSGFSSVSMFSAGGVTLKASEIHPNGSASYKNVPIFRSGSFKDSVGTRHTYEHEHITQAVAHYELLRSRGVLTPPVREDHSASITKVIGYFDAMRAETRGEYSYVMVDFTINRPDAVAKIENGTYRFRSAEVGHYETNDEAMYWPVIQGFAFVDMPAVEGLDAYASDQTTVHFSLHNTSKTKEPEVSNPTPTLHEFHLPVPGGEPVKTSDYARVQAALDAAAKPAVPPVHKFRIEGGEQADPAKVQQHIDVLENFRIETVKLAKEAFVDQLAASNVILATQVDGFKSHVAELDAAGFDRFKALYANSAANPLIGSHSDGGAGETGAQGGNGDPSEREILEETVTNLRRSGLSGEQIAKTDTYKRLQALGTDK